MSTLLGIMHGRPARMHDVDILRFISHSPIPPPRFCQRARRQLKCRQLLGRYARHFSRFTPPLFRRATTPHAFCSFSAVPSACRRHATPHTRDAFFLFLRFLRCSSLRHERPFCYAYRDFHASPPLIFVYFACQLPLDAAKILCRFKLSHVLCRGTDADAIHAYIMLRDIRYFSSSRHML